VHKAGISLAVLAIAALTAACGSGSEPAATTGGESEAVAPTEAQPPAEAAAPMPPGQDQSTAPELPAGGTYPGEPLTGEIETTASGLQTSVLAEGTGAMPTTGQNVSVHYTGYLLDGTKFDSSVDRGQPIQFPIGTGYVVKGWDEGIMLMKVGEKRKLIIPAELAYGAAGRPGIPPNAVLVFDVELVDAQ
jgi:FKBP-type peptidyl-prolyl cis-trans isomerase